MNLGRRRTIALLLFRVGHYRWRLMMSVILAPVSMVVNLLALFTKKTIDLKVKALTKAVASHTERSVSFCAECKAMTEAGKRLTGAMLAASSALQVESEHFQAAASKLSATKIVGAPVVFYVLTSMQGSVSRRQKKTKAFLTVISQLESPTFYSDLLLWFVIPHTYVEALLGDLAEEYQLRKVTDGEARAREWHRRHVRSTIKDHFWKTFERLTAIGTLIDLLNRWFGR
jgi:hypothetical protein